MKIINPDLWSLGQKLRWFVIVPPSLAVLLLTASLSASCPEMSWKSRQSRWPRRRIDDLALRVDSFFQAGGCPDPGHSLAAEGTRT